MDEDIEFLRWLSQRLIYVHKYNIDDIVLIKLNKHINSLCAEKKISISDNNLDKVISKYYTDFNLDKEENIGFTNQERDHLRQTIRMLVSDIINNKIPKETLLKR